MLTAIFVAVILTITAQAARHGGRGHPADAAGHPLRRDAAQRRLGEPDPLAGAGGRLRAPTPALWVYLTAPFVGAVIGWGIFRFLTPPDDEVSVEVDEDLDDELEDELEELLDEDEATALDPPAGRLDCLRRRTRPR